MIRGIGIDIIELERIQKVVIRKERFIDRILTSYEKKIYNSLTNERRKAEFLAGRFATKEAFSKAIGTGIGKLSFQDIEVSRNNEGAPKIHVQGYDPNLIFLSISHSKEYAEIGRAHV